MNQPGARHRVGTVLFFNELEDVLEILTNDQVSPIDSLGPCLFAHLARCMESAHFQVRMGVAVGSDYSACALHIRGMHACLHVCPVLGARKMSVPME